MVTIAIIIGAIAAIVAIGLTVSLLVLLFERRPVCMYSADLDDSDLESLPYAVVMTTQATVLKFRSAGSRRHVKGGTYKLVGSAWLSPSSEVAALVVSGTLLGIRVRSTRLCSRLTDGRYLLTADEYFEHDLSGLCERNIIFNADFNELVLAHEEWITQSTESAVPLSAVSFSTVGVWDALEEPDRQRVSRLVELGLVKFTDATEKTWRYRLLGALRMMRRMNTGCDQIDRFQIKRPGDAAYLPFSPSAFVYKELDRVREQCERGSFEGLSDKDKVILLVGNLESEVNNGGFHLWYFNSSGDNASATSAALDVIGASQVAPLVREANAYFGPDGPPQDRVERWAHLVLLDERDEGTFEELDGKFYAYPDDLASLLAAYWKSDV